MRSELILLIDNYDSFVHNLARYLRRLGQETLVVRNDQISVARVIQLQPEAIVLSPGPCTPKHAGCCLDLVHKLHNAIPMLGVCLGHQVIAEAFGGRVSRAKRPVHGQAGLVHHNETGVFAKVANPLRAGRYHSLIVEPSSVPPCLEITATLDDQTIMAIQHRQLPILGWQFHPESVLTQCGYQLLEGFLHLAGIACTASLPCLDNEVTKFRSREEDWFEQAIELP